MKLIHITDSILITEETVATIGFFDGVHRGHRYLIGQLEALAQMKGLQTSVITFPLHPTKVLQKKYQPQLINTFDERIVKLAEAGINYCYVLDFTPDLFEKTAEEFMCSVLSERLKIRDLIVGYDHRFGRDRVHNYDDYVRFGRKCGITVHRTDQYRNEDIHFSSTSIRKFLSEGNVKEAAHLLSYNYSIRGKVIEGNKIGRTIGIPTANLQPDSVEKIIPKNGVYAVILHLDGRQLFGMAYVGNRPTIFSGGEKRIEVHIFNFSDTIYGKHLQVEFIDFIRDDMRFNNLDELKGQLSEDKKNSIRILSQEYV